ncbi:MAG TPA: hypothetical protein VMH23_04770, partial [Bacteroidota bacterium]|nr:hypothetical protein [Bacteroidota bacterium]
MMEANRRSRNSRWESGDQTLGGRVGFAVSGISLVAGKKKDYYSIAVTQRLQMLVSAISVPR